MRKRDEKKATGGHRASCSSTRSPHKAFRGPDEALPQRQIEVGGADEPQNQGAWFFIQHQIHENT